MKSGYGKRKKDEEEALVSHETPAGATKDAVKNSSSRKFAAGALAVLLGVGTAFAYVAFPSESTISSAPVIAMESQGAYSIPSYDDDSGSSDSSSIGYIETFSDFDTNGDGVVSTVEYTAHMVKLRDDALARVAASSLPQIQKDFISDRLNKNFIEESTCITNMAKRVRDDSLSQLIMSLMTFVSRTLPAAGTCLKMYSMFSTALPQNFVSSTIHQFLLSSDQ